MAKSTQQYILGLKYATFFDIARRCRVKITKLDVTRCCFDIMKTDTSTKTAILLDNGSWDLDGTNISRIGFFDVLDIDINEALISNSMIKELNDKIMDVPNVKLFINSIDDKCLKVYLSDIIYHFEVDVKNNSWIITNPSIKDIYYQYQCRVNHNCLLAAIHADIPMENIFAIARDTELSIQDPLTFTNMCYMYKYRIAIFNSLFKKKADAYKSYNFCLSEPFKVVLTRLGMVHEYYLCPSGEWFVAIYRGYLQGVEFLFLSDHKARVKFNTPYIFNGIQKQQLIEIATEFGIPVILNCDENVLLYNKYEYKYDNTTDMWILLSNPKIETIHLVFLEKIRLGLVPGLNTKVD